MLALSVTLIIAALSAGLFLRAKSKTVLIVSAAALIVGNALYLLIGSAVPAVVCFLAGALCASVAFLLLEKRGVIDALLFLLTGVCQYGLWTVFRLENR